jgi:hypothetical protein
MMAHWLETLELPPEWAVPMVQDFERGEALRLEKAIRDQMKVSMDNARAEHRGVECLGQVEVQMASSLRQEIFRRYRDKGVMEDREYLAKLERDHGFRFKPNYQRKVRITHPGLTAA